MKKMVIGGVVVIVIIGGLVLVSRSKSSEESRVEPTSIVSNEVMKDSSVSKPATVPIKTEESKVQEEAPKVVEKKITYQGEVLAGKESPYLIFNTADYELAKKEGKIILLNFYASWCPICRAEAPDIKDGFNSLTSDKVVGFRVNFNDSDTDDSEKDLAKTFKVPYQHTKLIIINGKEVARYTDKWDKNAFNDAIQKALSSQ